MNNLEQFSRLAGSMTGGPALVAQAGVDPEALNVLRMRAMAGDPQAMQALQSLGPVPQIQRQHPGLPARRMAPEPAPEELGPGAGTHARTLYDQLTPPDGMDRLRQGLRPEVERSGRVAPSPMGQPLPPGIVAQIGNAQFSGVSDAGTQPGPATQFRADEMRRQREMGPPPGRPSPTAQSMAVPPPGMDGDYLSPPIMGPMGEAMPPLPMSGPPMPGEEPPVPEDFQQGAPIPPQSMPPAASEQQPQAQPRPSIADRVRQNLEAFGQQNKPKMDWRDALIAWGAGTAAAGARPGSTALGAMAGGGENMRRAEESHSTRSEQKAHLQRQDQFKVAELVQRAEDRADALEQRARDSQATREDRAQARADANALRESMIKAQSDNARERTQAQKEIAAMMAQSRTDAAEISAAGRPSPDEATQNRANEIAEKALDYAIKRLSKDPMNPPSEEAIEAETAKIARRYPKSAIGLAWAEQESTKPPAAAPPQAQRKAGTVYNTPKGPMIWRGNGWEPAP